jgi:twitching motility protein PilT
MEDLGIPKNVIDFLKGKQGFVLVTGPTGSGKSTSLAAMLQFINQNTSSHIVTVEDPVEYLLKPVKSTIDQREVFSDTMSFASALKSTLRQDPNVVLVGEMRDLETISSAITVAETGHLVFSTLHTNSASQSVDRIIDVFPENSQSQIRSQFASILSLVVSQRLLPAINGGRVAAFEIMVATSAVKNAIREGKTFMIDNMIQTGLEVGMLPLEMSLAKLVIDGKVDEGVAMSFALRPGELQQQLRSFKLHAKV